MTQRDRDGGGDYDQTLYFNAENKVQRVTESVGRAECCEARRPSRR
jgi:hypothetical protein